MSLYWRDKILWIDLRHRGRRVRRSTGTADKQAAKRQHDELAARLWTEKQTGRQVSDALLAWVKAKPRGRSDLNAVKLIRKEYKDRPLVDVSEASLLETFGARTPGTYNRLVVIVRAALTIAKRSGWIESTPHIVRRREPPPAVRFLRSDEWEALRAELPDHLRPMAEFAIATGLRWSNVAGLTWERVSMRRRLAWIEAKDAKGRRSIQIPLSKDAVAVLQRVDGDRAGYVFLYEGRPIQSGKTAWRKAVARAGLDGFRFHDLRHTWASWHSMGGTPPDVLQRLGAWRSPAMLQRYAHLADSYVSGFADNAKPLAPERKARVA